MNALATHPTTLHAQHCLNARHHDADCRVCAGVCPDQAITVYGADVVIDSDRCSGCGLCLHACPSEVFTTNRWSERTMLANVSELQTVAADCFCARHPHPETGSRQVGSLQIPTCLAAVSPGAWFELGIERRITVRLDACANCPLNAVVDAIRGTVDTANAWLRDAGHEAGIVCVETVDEGELLAQRPVVSAEHVRTSRRGFFRMLFNAAKQQSEPLPNIPEAPWTGDESPKKTPRLPSWMAHAAHAYAQHSRGSTAAAIWPAVTISDACVACGACTDYCPTGALDVDSSENAYSITFTPGQCVDCRICWASCPVGAITRSQSAASNPFERRPVLNQSISSCTCCGRPAEAGTRLCYWCAEEPPLVSVLSDARRWLLSAAQTSTPMEAAR